MRGNADQQNKPIKYKSKVSGNAKEKHMVTQIANSATGSARDVSGLANTAEMDHLIY